MLAVRYFKFVAVLLLPHGVFATPNDDLNRAVEKGDLVGVRKALRLGADCNNHYGHTGSTPLMDAAYLGNKEIVAALIKAKANVNANDNAGNTVLMHAISPNRHDNSRDVVSLLISHGANVNAGKGNLDTALIRAARSGNSEMVKLLLSTGANVRATGAGGHTPLIAAASVGHIEVVRLLLKARADIDAKTQYGESALAVAKINGNIEVVKVLKAAGAIESETVVANNTAGTRPAHNKQKPRRTGTAEIDAMISSCWTLDLAEAERRPRSFCHEMADCISTTIEKSHPCVQIPNLVGASCEKNESGRIVLACAGRKKLRIETISRAMKVAELEWRKKKDTSAGNAGFRPGYQPDNSPKPREKSEYQKWRNCHAAGQSGCGYQ